MRCILLGTSSFAIPTAEALLTFFFPLPEGGGTRAGGFLGVITKPDEPVGRAQTMTAPPLAVWAKERGVRCWQPDTKNALADLIRQFAPDVAVVVAYGRIIPPHALAIPRFGFVNVHPSLLPRWRGPSPVATAIAAGDAETGVTLMLLDAEMDHGPILAQERIPLSPTVTKASLDADLAARGAALLTRVLPEYLAGRITPQPQDDAQATTCPLLSREEGRLDWRKSAAELERLVRAYDGWPGTWCALSSRREGEENNKNFPPSMQEEGRGGVARRLKVLIAALNGPTTAIPGTILRDDGRFRVACGDGTALELTRVQPDGGTPMDGTTFLRGYRDTRALPV